MRIYIDTSVIGGCFDAEFSVESHLLIDQVKSRQHLAVISDLTLRELEDAPAHVRSVLEEIPDLCHEFVSLDEEASSLAERYVHERALPTSSLVDAQHIAIATIRKVDVLVSWNFKHIVNISRIRLYNSVNLMYGYPLLEIRSPREVLYAQDDR